MSRPIRTALLAFLLAAWPAAASDEVRLEFGSTSAWESDAVGGRDTGDLVWELRPAVTLEGQRKRLSYTLGYRSRVELHTRFRDADDASHHLTASARYQLDGRTALSLSNAFSLVPSIRRLNESISGPQDGETLVEARIRNEDILTNRFSASLSMQPFSRVQGVLTVSHFLREFEEGRTSTLLSSGDTSSVTLATNFDYGLSARSRVGLGFRWSRRESDRLGFRLETDDAQLVTTTYNLFANAIWRPDATTVLSARIGPAFSDDNREGLDQVTVQRFPRFPGAAARLLSTEGCDRIEVNGVRLPIVSPSCDPLDSVQAIDPATMTTVTVPQPDLDADQQAAVARQAASVGFLPGEQREAGGNVNIFANLTLQKTWDRWTFQASYSRSDSQTEGIGSATVVNTLQSSLRWTPTPRWAGVVDFAFSRRTTELERGTPVTVLGPPAVVPGISHSALGNPDFPFFGAPAIGLATLDDEVTFDVDSLQLRLRASRRLTPRLRTSCTARWRLDSGSGDLVRNERDRYEVRCGFNYSFRPIRL